MVREVRGPEARSEQGSGGAEAQESNGHGRRFGAGVVRLRGGKKASRQPKPVLSCARSRRAWSRVSGKSVGAHARTLAETTLVAPAGIQADVHSCTRVGETRSGRRRAIRSSPAGKPRGPTAGGSWPRGPAPDRGWAARFANEDSRRRTAREHGGPERGARPRRGARL